jgi:hypothetical protein
MTEPVENDVLEKGLKQPLLLSSEERRVTEDGDGEFDGSDEAPEEARGPATSIGSAYRLLTPSVKVWQYHMNFLTFNSFIRFYGGI